MGHRSIAAAVAVWLLTVATPAPGQDVVGTLAGRWHGTLTIQAAEIGAAADLSYPATVQLAPYRGGFALSWPAIDRSEETTQALRVRPVTDNFDAVGGRTIFEAESAESPLEDGVMTWARPEDGELVVYQVRMTRFGGYDLASYRFARDGDTLVLAVQSATPGTPVIAASGTLSREGG